MEGKNDKKIKAQVEVAGILLWSWPMVYTSIHIGGPLCLLFLHLWNYYETAQRKEGREEARERRRKGEGWE